MKILTIILIFTIPVLCQNKISKETYDGLVARQYKYYPVYDGPHIYIIYHNKDISTAGWDWPSNSSYNQYYLSQHYRGIYNYDLFNWRQLRGSSYIRQKPILSQKRMVLSNRRR